MTRRILILLFLTLLVPAASFGQSFSAILTGAAEVPGPGDADGSGLAVVTITGTTVRYTLFVQGINPPTAAHIHRGGSSVPGPVVVNFNPVFAGGGAFGEVSGVDQGLINEILGNPAGFYVNVHTADFPDGAIRGQLISAANLGGDTVSFLPVVGKVPGGNNTSFISDVRIVNTSASIANVTLDLFANNPAGQTAPTATSTLQIAPGAQAVLNDVVTTRFSTTGLGAVRITSSQPVQALSRIINDQRALNLGTAGFAFDAEPIEQAETSGVLPFLSNASPADIQTGVGFRTNLGYFNPGSAPVDVTFTARRSADGSVLGTKTVTIAPLSANLGGLFAVVDTVPEADRTQADFYLDYTATGPVFVYASVTDNKTGDGVFVQ